MRGSAALDERRDYTDALRFHSTYRSCPECPN